MSRRLLPLAFPALLLFLRSAPATAIVTQVDGTVVPTFVASGCPGTTDDCVQTALNVGEGFGSTATNNPLRQVEDARLDPQVFQVPKDGANFRKVEFWDLQEGAGYENTFGWYNVDSPATRYSVLACGDEPGAKRTVDFQVEFTAGRYKGGFVGFFMISPDSVDGTVSNCGSEGASRKTVIYTEAALNGDGNYAHYLLYESKKSSDAYYFAFEDLFHGGDNDFDDMLIKVTGLVKPCEPSAEKCDGLDNNCDGLVDNAPVDAGGACGTTDEGECQRGVLECQAGALVCTGAIDARPEVCDGKDNDCDQLVDEGASDVGVVCGSSVGECRAGATACIGGVAVCVGATGAKLETCDGKDNDCDGDIDEEVIDGGGPCGSSTGICEPGLWTCVSGALDCVGGTAEGVEACNGLDDDCDGMVDEGDPGGGAACGKDVGQCEPGVEHCVAGKLQCVGGRGETEELCDGLDNDCDGESDVRAKCPAETLCVEGTCAAPCGGGEFPCAGGFECREGYCLPRTCGGVVCRATEHCVEGLCVRDDSSTGGSAGTSSGGAGGLAGAGGRGGSQGDEPGDGERTTRADERWGLATGGGGCAVGGAGGDATRASVGAVAGLGLLLLLGRRRSLGRRAATAARRAS